MHHAPVVKRPITPPCHGGDRRFGGRGTELKTCLHVFNEYRREERAKGARYPVGPNGLNLTCYNLHHAPVVKRPITPPCHGGDRRFESGRARQKNTPMKVGVFFWHVCRTAPAIASVAGVIAGADAKELRTGTCSEHSDCVLRSNHPVGRARNLYLNVGNCL